MNYILIVDDSKTIAKGLKIYIEKNMPHVKCLVAADKKSTEIIVQKYKNISCALLDLHLPDAPNGEVVDFVNNLEIPIIVLTAKEGLRDKINFSHVVDYVIKDGIYSFYYAANIVQQIMKNKEIKVLVVDDSKVAVAQTSNLLKNYQLQVFTAYNGLEALEVIKQHPDIKLVYTDYNMPVMDGLELTRNLRKQYSKKELSIVVISSHSDSKVSSTLLKYGANDFLSKPYSQEEFYVRLNLNLEILGLFEDIERQNEENRKKDKIIQEQNKMAAMTDLIKNISHHWRQPLMAISANADSMKIDYELQMLDEKEIPVKMDNIIDSTQFLSKTIETFRDIISENVDIKEVVLQEEIQKVIELQTYSLKENNIKIISNIQDTEPVVLPMQTGALNKVMVYILNNANDILEQQDKPDKWVKIELTRTTSSVIISIEDNGGGIPDEINDRIYDAYFTTKHQSPGTGLGLHMARNIVHNTLDGKLYHLNTENGAKFFIELKLAI